MDFSLEPEVSEELEIFAKEVKGWLDENIPKDLISPRDPARLSLEQWQKRRELGRKLGKKGWLHPSFPTRYGGGGLDGNRVTILRRELAKRHIGLPPYPDIAARLAAPVVLAHGTEEQKQRFLPPMIKGEVYTWQLFTEPEAGTDEANQQTNALRSVREKDYFIVNGQKVLVGGNYPPPDQFLLLTRSDLKAPRHKNLALFLAPANLPGITITKLELFVPGLYAGICGPDVDFADGSKYYVFFDDVNLHDSYLIGGENNGWAVATTTLKFEHGGGEAWVAPDIVVEKFLAQCRSNPNIVRRLKENPLLVDTAVEIYIGAEIQRLFSIRNAAGAGGDYGGPQLEVFRKIYASKLTAMLARVLGPYALTDDVERGLDEGIFEVAERAGVCVSDGGTPEAMKIDISRSLSIGR